jgi:hypothetical protein
VNPADDYEQSWNDLRRRGRLVWLIAASFVPVVLVLIAVESVFFDDVPEYFGRWVGGSWIAALCCACVYRRGFRCPRCRAHFFDRSSFHSGSICSCCDLPLWANSGSNKPPMRKEPARKLVLIGRHDCTVSDAFLPARFILYDQSRFADRTVRIFSKPLTCLISSRGNKRCQLLRITSSHPSLEWRMPMR